MKLKPYSYDSESCCFACTIWNIEEEQTNPQEQSNYPRTRVELGSFKILRHITLGAFLRRSQFRKDLGQGSPVGTTICEGVLPYTPVQKKKGPLDSNQIPMLDIIF